MMVKETHILFAGTDITNVRVHCTKCKGQVLYPMAEDTLLLRECPYCGASWVGDSESYRHLSDLLDALRFFRKSSAQHRLTTTFEMPAD